MTLQSRCVYRMYSCREDGTDGRCAALTAHAHSPLRRSVPSLVSCFIKVISTYYSCTQLNLLVESVFTMSVEGNKSHEWNVKLLSPFKLKHERQMKIDIIIKLTHEVSSVMKDIKLNRANIQLNIFKQVM